jgi:nucleoside-diphosphate kinase
MKEFSFVKPDAFMWREEILKVLTYEGYKIAKQVVHTITVEEAKLLYAEHEGKSFYKGLMEHIPSGPSLLLLIEHETASIEDFRKLLGASDPAKAAIGTIRELFGDPELYAQGIPANAIHGSDSEQNAQRETKIFENVFNT